MKKPIKRVLQWIGIILLVLIVSVLIFYLIYLRPVLNKMLQTHAVPYDQSLTIVLGGGGNSGILVSDSLVLVIDTKFGDAAEEFSKTVKDAAGNKPILVVNTHYHPDHANGNVYYTGQSILAGGGYTKELWIKKESEETLPTQWLKDSMDIRMGDDTATIVTLNRNAHTEGDVFVYLHGRKMLFGGDVILNKQIPSIEGAADPDGYMNDYDDLIGRFDIREIVPGHGPMGGLEIIENMRQYFNDMKTIAADPSREKELIVKYKDWTQVPMMMSPGATINAYKKKG